MNHLFRPRHIDSLDVAKALGILFVIANHSSWHNLAGGLNVLLLIAGINFARFSLAKPNRDIVKDILLTLKKVLPISLALIILSFLIQKDFSWQELLLFSNFYTYESISLFPVWYVQVLLQMFLVLVPLIYLLNFEQRVRRASTAFCFVIFIALFTLPIVIERFFSAQDLYWKVPHHIAWNFVLGWVVWSLLYQPQQEFLIAKRLVCMALVCVGSVFFFVYFQGVGWIRALIFLLLSSLFLCTQRFTVPEVIYRPLILLAGGVFYLFLFHGFVMHFIEQSIAAHVSYHILAFSNFFGSVVICMLLYVFATAFQKALNKYKPLKSQ